MEDQGIYKFITMSLLAYNPILCAGALALPLLINPAVAEHHVTIEALGDGLGDFGGMKGGVAMSMGDETGTDADTETNAKTTETEGEEMSTTAMTTATDLPATGVQTVWAQCGGTGYTGATSCGSGMSCASVNDNWAHCVSESTLVSSRTIMSSRDTAKVSSSAESLTMGLSQSTIYSYTTDTVQYTITSTDSAGHTYKTTINSESTKAVAKGFTEVTVSSNSGSNSLTFFSPTDNQHWKRKAVVGGVFALSILLM